ncbi:MAG TPA: ParB/Srx family N-terminal domain-containing protein [Bacteroidales bacterium]|jgi:hypothetical protein|nr:ParB/Srx family N-terminal domain-containing protein [Bacteroidales bacterium]HOD87374.1 ParB/Srx family N-terminal domain-containing protein [Bacteroidales bacterium]
MSNVKHEKIPVTNLILDSKNPRLPKSMSNKSEKEIINFLLSDASLIELMLAISKNDFFEGEQLLVVPDEGDKYLVVEGNRRLSAVKLLHNPELGEVYKSKIEQVIREAEHKPTDLPCLIFEDKDEILKYLGYRHITGIKSWKLLEKARYLAKLKNDYFPSYSISSASREIAKMIGSRKDYVVRVLAGYKLYEIIENNGFYRISGLDDTTFYFNYLADSLSRSNIAEFLGVDFNKDNPTENVQYTNLKEWTNWLFNKELPNKIIGDSENLNTLNKVIASPEALKAFRDGENLFVAIEFTDEFDVQFENAIKNSIRHMEKADLLTVKVVHFYSSLDEDLNEIYQRIKKIKSAKGLRDDEF